MTVAKIAVDAMGGDRGPKITVPASIAMLEKHPNLHLVLVGDQAVLSEQLNGLSYDHKRLEIKHASECVGMDELPSVALRTKKDSSMRVAINLVKEGEVQACVSAGNTGALMATARFVLKMLPGVDRPAIVSAFPTLKHNKLVRMLDLGANVDSSPENLIQFAVMGSVLASAVGHVTNPKVCLLNIGEEEIKGSELVKQTAQRLSNLSSIHYAGYIEGDAIYNGDVDVVVCDGFVGNVALKASEGVAKLIGKMIKAEFTKNIFTMLAGLLVKPVLRSFRKRIDPAGYNGATLIGLQGTVIKSHGDASARGFARAIEEAMMGVEHNVPELIRHQVEQLLSHS